CIQRGLCKPHIVNLHNNVLAAKMALLGSTASINPAFEERYFVHLPVPHPISIAQVFLLTIVSSIISKYSSAASLIRLSVKSLNLSHSSPNSSTTFLSILFP